MGSWSIDNDVIICYYSITPQPGSRYDLLLRAAHPSPATPRKRRNSGLGHSKQLENQARMAELADALDSGSSAGNGVQVQLLLRALVLGNSFVTAIMP